MVLYSSSIRIQLVKSHPNQSSYEEMPSKLLQDLTGFNDHWYGHYDCTGERTELRWFRNGKWKPLLWRVQVYLVQNPKEHRTDLSEPI
jgi:hypothetical protein